MQYAHHMISLTFYFLLFSATMTFAKYLQLTVRKFEVLNKQQPEFMEKIERIKNQIIDLSLFFYLFSNVKLAL